MEDGGEAGVRRGREGAFDRLQIVLDVMLPKKDGFPDVRAVSCGAAASRPTDSVADGQEPQEAVRK